MTKRSKTYAAIPPGATIKEQLDDRGMTQKEFAARMGMSEKHISKLVNGEVRLTPNVAARLESVLGISATFWLNLEAIYQEKLMQVEEENSLAADSEIAKRFPYGEMAAHGWVPKTRKAKEKATNLRRYFEVARLEYVFNGLAPNVAYRRQSVTPKSEYALIAWSQQAKLEARGASVKRVDLDGLRACISTIRAMTCKGPDEFCDELVTLLSLNGIALVFLPHFRGSYLHGATFEDSGRVVMGLTVRGSYSDKFWFSLFHEIGHIIYGHVGKEGGTTEDDEAIADEFARDTLIAPDDYARLLSIGKPTARDVVDFASTIGIAPAIVVGRLQKDGIIPYTQMNDLKERYEIAE